MSSRVYHHKDTDAVRIENQFWLMPLSKEDAGNLRAQLNKIHEQGMIP